MTELAQLDGRYISKLHSLNLLGLAEMIAHDNEIYFKISKRLQQDTDLVKGIAGYNKSILYICDNKLKDNIDFCMYISRKYDLNYLFYSKEIGSIIKDTIKEFERKGRLDVYITKSKRLNKNIRLAIVRKYNEIKG